MIIAAENVVGIHKKEGALVINNGESLSFCQACLQDVADAEIDFNEERPCVICQLPGGPVLHARVPGQKHDYVTPRPEVVPFSDVELSESRAQVDALKNSKLKGQLLRLYATVDYWMSEARREADLRQPALDERDAARDALTTTLDSIAETVNKRFEERIRAAIEEKLAAFMEEMSLEDEKREQEAARLLAARKEWTFPLQLTSKRVVVFTLSTYDIDALAAIEKGD